MLKVVHDADASNHTSAAGGSLLDEIVRDGARAMLAAALQAEVAAYIDAHGGEVDEKGYRLVVSSNVLAALPKSAHPGAKAALAEIYNAEDRDHALNAVKAFEADYGAKWPEAVAKITEHTDVLLAFYDYPAQHWIHLRTTNPIESTFATVRLRQRVTKGPGSRAAGVAMAFKLIESAQARWRAVNAPHLVALVRAGARFEKGKLVERPDESGGDQQVA